MAKGDKKLSALDRLTEAAIGHDLTFGLVDDPVAKECPELWRWLTMATPAVGKLVVPASLTVRLGPEGVLITLNHRDYAVSLDVSCPYLKDVWEALERALTSPNPPIRRHSGKEPKFRKRKTD